MGRTESLPQADIRYRATDVAVAADMEALAQTALDAHGRIDAIFNNAGVMPTANLSEKRFEEWKRMLDINVMGVLHGIAAVLVDTELYTTIADKEFGAQLSRAAKIPGIGLTPDDVAGAVAYALGAPASVAISEILMRPTNQAI
ncbi:SDR family NAD(P)-dependent oxidoreductase [bacterium]|nr:SDR family NAD(P)-dependent oxidoreductase [bacterium]